MKKKKLHELARELKDILSPLGFSRKSSTWRRDNGWCVDVIEFQMYSFGGVFTINVGVVTKSVWATAWGKDPPAFPIAADGTVGSRLGRLARMGGDWRTDDENWLAEATAAIQSGALPFFERMHDRKEQRRFLWANYPQNRVSLQTAYIAILMFEDGEREEGCSLLRDFRSPYDNQGWVDWRSAVLARLGCPTP